MSIRHKVRITKALYTCIMFSILLYMWGSLQLTERTGLFPSGLSLPETTDKRFTPKLLGCNEKYSEGRRGASSTRIFIAALLHNNGPIIEEWSVSVVNLAKEFTGTYVSIFESGSIDNTVDGLSKLKQMLLNSNIGNTIIYGEEGDKLAGPPFIPGDSSSGNRISYLARLRNLVLRPLLDLKVRGSVYDKVVFLNDVLFCVGDIQRLLSHDANIACGYDFNGPTFWDNWVMDYGSTDSSLHSCARDSQVEQQLACKNSMPLRAACCWNGAAVFDSAIIYGGVQFRRGEQNSSECSNSECSIFCRDARAQGFVRVVVDPTVQLSYSSDFPLFRRPLPLRPVALREMSAWHLPPESNCCELLQDGQQYIEWEKCYLKAT